MTESDKNKLKQENVTLQKDFAGYLTDRTRGIEQQMLEISHLQTLFANKVVQQKEAISKIHR